MIHRPPEMLSVGLVLAAKAGHGGGWSAGGALRTAAGGRSAGKAGVATASSTTSGGARTRNATAVFDDVIVTAP